MAGKMERRLTLSLIGVLFCLLLTDSAVAGQIKYSKDKPPSNLILISNNSGGNIAEFALRMSAIARSSAQVSFAGRCDSACTMYLGLPEHKICIAPGAYFRFHMPQARSAQTTNLAKRFLYRKYPGWVRSWIASRGGLSTSLITMDYSYARRFIRPC
jgi:hypothetical protein